MPVGPGEPSFLFGISADELWSGVNIAHGHTLRHHRQRGRTRRGASDGAEHGGSPLSISTGPFWIFAL